MSSTVEGVQTPAEGGPVAPPLDMDSIIGKYFPDESAISATPAPKDTEGLPGEKADTPVTDSDFGAEDTPEADEGGVETGEELEEGQTEEPQPGDEEDEEVEALLAASPDQDSKPEPETPKESFLPEFDRVKFLKEHPELEAPYKHMQAAFTKKMAAMSGMQKLAEQAKVASEAMQTQLHEFEKVLENDATFEDFLVQVSLNRPEVMERAFERAVALNEDEGKKKEYLKDRELADVKRQLKEQDERAARLRVQERTAEIIGLTKRVAVKLGLTSEGDLRIAEQYVANQILSNVANGGERDLTAEQLVAAVRQAAKAVAGTKESVRQTTRAANRQDNLRAAQDRLRQPPRPSPPRPGIPATAPANNRIDHRPKQAPLDSWIDSQLGVEP